METESEFGSITEMRKNGKNIDLDDICVMI